MNLLSFIATTWFGHEHRFLGLDWNYLVILGLIGTATFSMRFLVQWWASERQGESVIPVSFFYWSIAGSIIMFLYFFFCAIRLGSWLICQIRSFTSAI